MNRIRKVNEHYEILITPHQRFNAGTEILLGNWTDPNLKGN